MHIKCVIVKITCANVWKGFPCNYKIASRGQPRALTQFALVLVLFWGITCKFVIEVQYASISLNCYVNVYIDSLYFQNMREYFIRSYRLFSKINFPIFSLFLKISFHSSLSCHGLFPFPQLARIMISINRGQSALVFM